MKFKDRDIVFSNKALKDPKVLAKESLKYRGQYFEAKIGSDTIRGIWLSAFSGPATLHYLNYLFLGYTRGIAREMTLTSYGMFHNTLSVPEKEDNISLNWQTDKVESLTVGEKLPTPEERKRVIKFFFEEMQIHIARGKRDVLI
jgi:hypothetical protein